MYIKIKIAIKNLNKSVNTEEYQIEQQIVQPVRINFAK